VSTSTLLRPEGGAAPTGRALRMARRVTDVLEPKSWIFAVLFVVGIASDGVAGAAWAGHAAVFAAVVPMLVIKSGMRRGNWTDRHLSARGQRLRVIPMILASLTVGIALMWAGNAPRELLAVVATMVVTLAVIMAITTAWKISVHTSVAGGAATMLALVLGPWWSVVWALALLVGWSRIALKDHTFAQVAAGALLGPTVPLVVFAAMV
jgi:membrane-associated phospholipid phosphatase